MRKSGRCVVRWPEPGVSPVVTPSEIPVGTSVDGMGPIGVRCTATRTRDGWKLSGLPSSEFCPCFVELDGVVHEVVSSNRPARADR